MPRVLATLTVTVAATGQQYNLTSTGPDWVAYDASLFHSPFGDNGNGAWYHLPNENLNASVRPVGWEGPGYTPGDGWVPVAIQPPFTAELYWSPLPRLPMLWRTPCNITQLPNRDGTCGASPEGGAVSLTCYNGGVISNITFASFGTPSGDCDGHGGNTFAVNASCNSVNSTRVVSQACLGKPACTVQANKAIFGADPCDKVFKRLAIAVACSGPSSNGTSSYRYLLDFGQQMMGGLNLTFVGAVGQSQGSNAAMAHQQGRGLSEGIAGHGSSSTAVPPTVLIKLGEELLPANESSSGAVMVPTRAGENYTSLWTLAPWADPTTAAPANTGLFQHEFIQFRYAEIVHSPVPLDYSTVRAWVVQHPFDGTGVNPWEVPCAASTPNIPVGQAGTASMSSTATPTAADRPSYGWFSSSNAGLDAVFNMTAYTAVATSLDINVDSQTRQRDLCHIDALITGHEQFSVFPTGDYAVQRRTFRNAFGNDSAIWGSWTEFKQSGSLMAWLDALETGDLTIAADMWSDNDDSITSDAYPSDYNSLQFYTGLRYFNLSGNGLLHYPADCGGSWACDPLVDWPTNTRDGYIVDPSNTEDAVRNGLGAVTIAGLAQVAAWLGKDAAAQRYTAMAASIRAGLVKYLLANNSTNSSEAYFVDGSGQSHAAVHSTVYGVISGAVAGTSDPTLPTRLANYLIRRNVVPSSCMTGRWYVQALYQLGVWEGRAADFGLELLSRTEYPSWGNMIVRGATTTLEAWQPEDKWNTDWAHPWCASPAFLIPRWLMGVQPTDIGWSRFTVAPQPGNLTSASVRIPTVLGSFWVNFTQTGGSTPSVDVAFAVPTGSTAHVCMPPAHPDVAGARAGDSTTGHASAADQLIVDGAAVPSTAYGRLLCTVTDLTPGPHIVARQAGAAL